MELDFNDVIERLSAKLGKLETDLMIKDLAIEKLQARIRELEGETGEQLVSESNST